MAIYKYVRADVAKQILSGTIRITQPGAFNDPFELLPQFIVPNDLMGTHQSYRFDCLAKRRNGLCRNGSHGLASNSDVETRKLRAELDVYCGVICLSRCHENLLMWGHYADDYRGAVIEFDEGHEFFDGLIPVVYKRKRPVYDISDFVGGKLVPVADLCVKPNAWAYEKEVRVVRELSGCKMVGHANNGSAVWVAEIPKGAIKGVIMGQRMPVVDRREILNMVLNEDWYLDLAAIANWDYAFQREQVKLSGRFIGNLLVTPRTAEMFLDMDGAHGAMARHMLNKHPASELVNMKC